MPDLIVRPGAGPGGADEVYRVVADHLGSPRLVVRQSDGKIAQRTDYDAWGNVTSDYLAPDVNGGAPIHPLGFAGGLHDRDTGLVRFGARDYDPEVGRWTTKDPLGLMGDLNLYRYCRCNPVNWVDPTGFGPDPSFFFDLSDVLDVIQDILDKIGLSPWWGEPFDALSGLISALRGDWEGAGLSAASMVPGVGGAPGLAKISRRADKLMDARRVGRGGGCFVAGTVVLTPDGPRPIEDLEVGDEVIAGDPETGETETAKIERTFVRHNIPILGVHFDDTVVTTTAEHPFWVTDAGWTEAGDLEPGMRVATASGATVAVERVKILDRTATVHNIEVDGLHTYFVTDEYVLVHNKAWKYVPPKVLQTGGKKIRNSTAKKLGMTKDQARDAIHGLKDDLNLRNDFHSMKIYDNGDVVSTDTGEILGNLWDYLP